MHIAALGNGRLLVEYLDPLLPFAAIHFLGKGLSGLCTDPVSGKVWVAQMEAERDTLCLLPNWTLGNTEEIPDPRTFLFSSGL